MSRLSIELIPCLSNNYAYLVTDTVQGLCAAVDPSEADPVRERLRARGLNLTHILNTHHHPDHTGGNLALKEEFGAPIVGPENDRARIPGLDVGVGESAPWHFGNLAVTVLEIPAHTRGHIAFVFPESGPDCANAFTGDTLFAMGCGRLFEGTPAMMWAAMQKLMALPDATRVYCGHEYTLGNGRFALTLEPGNPDLQVRMREVEDLRAKGLPTIPTTIGLEKRTNPFMRPDSPEIRRILGMDKAHDVDVLAETRRRKDNF